MMKNKSWYICIWIILWFTGLFMVMPASGTAHAQAEGGYWELISVDVVETPAKDNYTYNISQGTGTLRAESNGESFGASMTWTEPGQRYAGGQSVDLTIGVRIDEYIWDDDEPGYLNQGLNYMGANIYALIDEPNINLGGVTRGAIYFTDSQDEYLAKVETDYGKIVNESQTLDVSAVFPSGGSDGDEKSIYVKCNAGMNRYNYRWVGSDSAGFTTIPEIAEPEPEWEPLAPAASPGAEGGAARVIVVVGIAIAGTLSAVAAELANKAAQAAASGKDEQPAEEIVYVLNPSHKRFDLEVDKPVTLTVNGYKVTQGGYQTEPDAQISIALPPVLAEYIQLQTTGSNGQVSCIITLIKIPSAATATLDIQGVFPQGKASTKVQLAFKMEFAIYPVRSPNITYYEKDQQWLAPELVACFRDPVQETPLRVGFYYGFRDPPLTFEPDILEVKEAYSTDDGLTYNFKLNLRDGIDLESYFGEDLTDDDGRVTVTVVVKDEQGKEYTAKRALQVSPQLRLVACSYHQDVKTRGLRATPYDGLELDDMEFIADGVDKLPLVLFFIRSDKEISKGSEAEAAMDIVEVQKIDCITETAYEEPTVNAANTGGGFFAYDLSSRELIALNEDTLNGEYWLEVDARIRAGGPKNYSFEGNSLRFAVKPQFVLLRLWVVPGYKRGTSEAIAYAKLLPCHKPFTGLKLSLETSGGGGAALHVDDETEKVTRIKDSPIDGAGISFKMVKGTARWILTYSGMKWDNLPGAQYQVTCNGPKDAVGNYVTASESIDVNANVLKMLSDLFNDSDLQAHLNNPYNFKENTAIPEFLNGPIWNVSKWFNTKEPFVCHQMRLHIIDFLQERRLYRSDGDLNARLALMRGMNGFECENYYIFKFHVWAGFFLSGTLPSNFKALDPWWEQRWVDPSFKQPENLMTLRDETWNVTKTTAAVGIIVTAAGSALAAAGVAVSVVALTTLLRCILLGMTVTAAAQAAGLTNITFSSAIPYGSTADPNDQTVVGFSRKWLMDFIPRLDQQDLDEWRKS